MALHGYTPFYWLIYQFMGIWIVSPLWTIMNNVAMNFLYMTFHGHVFSLIMAKAV